jgi:hypothetical protein
MCSPLAIVTLETQRVLVANAGRCRMTRSFCPVPLATPCNRKRHAGSNEQRVREMSERPLPAMLQTERKGAGGPSSRALLSPPPLRTVAAAAHYALVRKDYSCS